MKIPDDIFWKMHQFDLLKTEVLKKPSIDKEFGVEKAAKCH